MAGTSLNMQRAFGADVAVAVADIGLYFVCASGSTSRNIQDMQHALNRVNAQVAARVSQVKVLAVMRYEGFERLRADKSIGLVGPVALDPERFRLFQQVAGIGDGDGPLSDNS